MWTYSQSSGNLYFGDVLVATGYSGHGDGKNNPALESVRQVGPIPAGRWRLVGGPFDSPATGPFCLRLLPREGTQTFGRSGFLIHGDSKSAPGTASHGCIVLPRKIRQAIWESVDTELLVVADDPQSTVEDLEKETP